MDGTISEIRMFAGSFAPRGWAFCNGQSLPISQYDALFSLIGTTYGGDGVQTFNLPDIQSRVAIGAGHAPGLSNYILGQIGGAAGYELTVDNIGMHSHPITGTVAGVFVSGEDGHFVTPVGNYPAVSGDTIYSTTTDNSTMAAAQISLIAKPTGSKAPLPIPNMKPFIAINYIICTEGLYPSRN